MLVGICRAGQLPRGYKLIAPCAASSDNEIGIGIHCEEQCWTVGLAEEIRELEWDGGGDCSSDDRRHDYFDLH